MSGLDGTTSRTVRIDDLLAAGVFAVLAILLLANFERLSSLSLSTLGWIALAITIPVSAFLAMRFDRGFWSGAVVFFTLFSLFHFGVVIALALGLLSDQAWWLLSLHLWLHSPSTGEAVVLAALGALGLAAGVLSANGLLGRRPSRIATSDANSSSREELLSQAIAATGTVLVAGAVLVWLAATIRMGGPTIFLGSYHRYLDLMRAADLTSLFAWNQFFLGCGMVFLGAGRVSSIQRVGLGIFAVLFVPLALPLGLRGEVLFPLLTFAVIYFLDRRPPSFPRLAIALFGLLSIVSFIKVYRQPSSAWARSPTGGPASWFNPFDAVAEMGASLRPVVAVLDWQSAGMPLMYGASYWAPIERRLSWLVSSESILPAAMDQRLPSNLVAERVGNIGFSVVAEAVLNFGIVGPFPVLAIVGAVVVFFEKRAQSVFQRALYGVILLQALGMIRGQFTNVPIHFLIAVAMMFLVRTVVLSTVRTRETKQSVTAPVQGMISVDADSREAIG